MRETDQTLTDKRKRRMRKQDFLLVPVYRGVEERADVIPAIFYANSLGKPVYILKEKDWDLPDELKKAKIAGIREYEDGMGSPNFIEAREEIKKVARAECSGKYSP